MKYLFLLGCSLAIATPALAQDAASGDAGSDFDNAGSKIALSESYLITVTATGQQSKVTTSGQSISVLTDQDITRTQGSDITRVLERLPGVTFARNGGQGSATSLFVRGANSEQLLVLIDGVRMEDTAAPSGGFDFANLESGGISRIELLRGSNSIAWGSDAMGGVLAVTTREVDGLAGSVEYGAHDTLSLDGGAGISRDAYAISVNAGYTRSDGISAAAAGTEPDPYRQWRIGGKARANLADNLSLNATYRHSENRVAFDSWLFVDDSEYQTAMVDSGRVGFEYGDGSSFSLSGGLALSNTHREYFDPSWTSDPTFISSGRSVRADLRGHLALPSNFALDFGGDSEWSRFSSTYDPRQTARLSGVHAMLGYHGDRLHLTAGARYDDHSRFGSHWTFGANGSFDLGSDWRIKASYGEGFKAPTLYQLYGYGGNLALKAETSRSYEAGIEKRAMGGKLFFAATAFNRDSTNLIDYVWPTGYLNVAKARARGIELEARATVTANFTASATYTYLEATNRGTGKDLPRRANHALTTSLDWTTPLAGLKLGADLRLVGDSFDNASNTSRLDGYGLLTLRAAVPVGEHFELFGRVENVTDQTYQVAKGYGTYGRSAYAGLRLKW